VIGGDVKTRMSLPVAADELVGLAVGAREERGG
jgi:hypothetical protein